MSYCQQLWITALAKLSHCWWFLGLSLILSLPLQATEADLDSYLAVHLSSSELLQLQAFQQEIAQNSFLLTMQICEAYRDHKKMGPMPGLQAYLANYRSSRPLPTWSSQQVQYRLEQDLLVSKTKTPAYVLREHLQADGYYFSKSERRQALQKIAAQGVWSFWQAFTGGSKNLHSRLSQVSPLQAEYYLGSVFLHYFFRTEGFYKASVICLGFSGKAADIRFRADRLREFKKFIVALDAMGHSLGAAAAVLPLVVALEMSWVYVGKALSYSGQHLAKRYGKRVVRWIGASLGVGAVGAAGYLTYNDIHNIKKASEQQQQMQDWLAQKQQQSGSEWPDTNALPTAGVVVDLEDLSFFLSRMAEDIKSLAALQPQTRAYQIRLRRLQTYAHLLRSKRGEGLQQLCSHLTDWQQQAMADEDSQRSEQLVQIGTWLQMVNESIPEPLCQ